MAAHHIGGVLEAYRQVGLREETERVHLLLEARAKGVIAEMKQHRVEIRLDSKKIEDAIANAINVSHTFAALYRLADCFAPQPGRIKKLLEDGGFVAHRLMPTAIIGDNGLPVSIVSTYDQDKEGPLVMEVAREMGLNATFFLSGFEEWKKKFEIGSAPEIPNILDCLLISADRVTLYRDGLVAFETEDYLKCIHVLVPQVENSLRELLRLLEIPSTKTDGDGGFELKNMNDVLRDPRVRESLDEKLWFFLKVLYIDKRGMNLRNLVAHGIAPVESFNRVNAALVVQSIVFLTMIRKEALSLAEDGILEADPQA